MKVLAYWAARTGIFVAVLALLWAVGWRDVLAMIAAFIVGWLISYLALPALRVNASTQMEGWVTRSHDRRHLEDAVEDAESDPGALQGDPDSEQDSVREADRAEAPENEGQAGRSGSDAHGDSEQQRR